MFRAVESSLLGYLLETNAVRAQVPFAALSFAWSYASSGPANSGLRKTQPLPQAGHPGVVDTKNLWGHNWRTA